MMRERSRITFGCCYHEEYVTEYAFELIKQFVSLPPADYYIRDQEVWYDVASHHVVQGRTGTKYRIRTDFSLTESTMWKICPLHLPHKVPIYSSHLPRSALAHFVLNQEETSSVPFTLFQDADFHDVEIYTRIREVVNIWDGLPWTWIFKEIKKRPYRDLRSDEYLYFTDPSVYQIELIPPIVVTVDQVKEFLVTALPRSCYWPSDEISGRQSSNDTHRDRI